MERQLRFTNRVFYLFLAVVFLNTGCGNLGYLIQAGKGQLALINHARPISEVIRDEKVPPRIRRLLSEIEPIKKFSEKHGIKPTSNYSEYVKLDRNAAVWVVSACETLRFKSKDWSFPIVGSIPYLGWFNLENAKEFSEQLKKEGWDVDLRGAQAFSTLGWFRDAILSTMIPEGEEALGELVNVVIHESVHATLYISGQSYFNESLATFVADQLTLDYLARTQGKDSSEVLRYLELEKSSKKIRDKLYQAYLQLSQIYASENPAEQKLKEKEQVLSQLKAELQFKRDINNATLIQFRTYHVGSNKFLELFKTCGENWPRFFAYLERLKDKGSFQTSNQENLDPVLAQLIGKKCL